jgi:solute carrier family 25 phosphate transporter 23/24/25/41
VCVCVYIYISDASSIGWHPRGQFLTWSLLALIGVQDRFTVQRGRYGNVWHAIRKITQEEGIEAFYKGLVPTIIGLVPYCAAYYFVYGSLTCSYRHYSDKKQLGNLETLTFGAFAGPISSLSLQTSPYNPERYFFHIYVMGWINIVFSS